MPSPGERPAGLRERKKARTRAQIQHEALRLFREQGYEATTVSQIAAAAEVSESTFFRYFPTKEDVVLWDPFDPQMLRSFHAQPADRSPVAALRVAFAEVMGVLSAEQVREQKERTQLLLSVPPLRATLLDSSIRGPLRLLDEALAARTRRKPGDPWVWGLAGAVVGVCLAAMVIWAEDPDSDVLALVDEGLAQLEAGFPLQ